MSRSMMTGLTAILGAGGGGGISGPAEADYNTFGFDGTSEYIDFGDDFELLGNDFTLLTWVRFSSTSNAAPTFMSKWGSGGSNYKSWHFFFDTASNELRFQYSVNGSSQTSLAASWSPTLNTWYMVAVKRETSNIRFFVDGVQQGTNQNISTDIINNSNRIIRIGAYEDSVVQSISYMQGSMTCPIISNQRAFSDVELSGLYQSGKVPYYETLPSSITDDVTLCVEMSSRDNSLNDLSGNGNNGTANGGVTDDGDLQTFTPYETSVLTPDQLQGLQLWLEGDTGYTDKSSNAYTVTNNGSTNTDTLNGLNVFSFNGSSQYINMGAQLGKPASFTIISVINTNSTSTQYIAGSMNSIGSATTVWGNFFLSQSGLPTGSLLSYNSSNTDFGTSWSTDNLLSASTWYVIAQRYTAGNDFIDIWVDGVQATIAQNSFGDSNEGTTYDYSIGRAGEFAFRYFNGKISEHIVSNAAESTQDILDLTSSLQTKYAL